MAQESWDGPFSQESYDAAHRILEADRERAQKEVRGVSRKRGRIVGAVAVVWAICSVILTVLNPEWLVIAEVGWVVIVFWAVFWLMPAIMGRANIDDIYTQYEAQLKKLEDARIPMPEPACIEDLVAAIDLVSPPDDAE